MYTYMYMCITIVGGNPHILMILWSPHSQKL